MALDFKLPEMGEGVNEGELVRWLVKEGDQVTHDQPLVEMMTDKATVEIPSPASGKVSKIVAKEGDVIKVGQILLQLDGAAGGEKSAPEKAPAKAAAQSQAEGQPAGQNLSKPQQMETLQAQGQDTPQRRQQTQQHAQQRTETANKTSGGATDSQISPPSAGADVLATPSTRRYARESGVDINGLAGSGPAGRVTRDDVIKAAGAGTGAVSFGFPTMAKSGAAAPQGAPTRPLPTSPAFNGQNVEQRKPFRGIRKKIAENLVHSKQTIPHFTHVDEVDVTNLVQWRTQMKEQASQYGIKLTYLPLIMKALVATCREFPAFNTSLDDEKNELVEKHYYNVGFAADTPEGLLVPNVKNVETKSILQVAKEISELADKARRGKLGPDDMRHGTITITNIGSVGGIYATPIINWPEVAIIGVYEIQKKPVVINDKVEIREMMNVTATCDHRVVDGAVAARFLKKFKERLANPQALLLEMI